MTSTCKANIFSLRNANRRSDGESRNDASTLESNEVMFSAAAGRITKVGGSQCVQNEPGGVGPCGACTVIHGAVCGAVGQAKLGGVS